MNRLGCVLLLMLAVMSVVSPAQNTAGPFSLSLEAEENLGKTESEVKVDITLRNSSNRAIDVSMSLAEVDYAIDVRDSQNRIPPETESARKSKGKGYISNEHVFTLQPGESLPKEALAVSKFYELNRPGKYTIQVSRVVPKELGGGTVKSNTIAITIPEKRN